MGAARICTDKHGVFGYGIWKQGMGARDRVPRDWAPKNGEEVRGKDEGL